MSDDLIHLASGLSPDELRAAMIELCDAGLLVCTSGQPGDDVATYAVAWMPLDHPEQYTREVRRQHADAYRQFWNSTRPMTAGEKHD